MITQCSELYSATHQRKSTFEILHLRAEPTRTWAELSSERCMGNAWLVSKSLRSATTLINPHPKIPSPSTPHSHLAQPLQRRQVTTTAAHCWRWCKSCRGHPRPPGYELEAIGAAAGDHGGRIAAALCPGGTVGPAWRCTRVAIRLSHGVHPTWGGGGAGRRGLAAIARAQRGRCPSRWVLFGRSVGPSPATGLMNPRRGSPGKHVAGHRRGPAGCTDS